MNRRGKHSFNKDNKKERNEVLTLQLKQVSESGEEPFILSRHHRSDLEELLPKNRGVKGYFVDPGDLLVFLHKEVKTGKKQN